MLLKLPNASLKKVTLLKIMKYTIQSPTVYEQEEEYQTTFKNINSSLSEYGYYYTFDKTKAIKRPNAFVPLCKHGAKIEIMTFLNCNLFKRSFTNKGIGFTYNSKKVEDLIKKSSGQDEAIKILSMDKKQDVVKMESASSDNALTILIDYNEAAVKRYENTINEDNQLGTQNQLPKKVSVTIHDPIEPANLRSNSFEIPLGHTTTVYITPRAREIDESGIELSEKQRKCRLTKDSSELKIFSKYTQEIRDENRIFKNQTYLNDFL